MELSTMAGPQRLHVGDCNTVGHLLAKLSDACPVLPRFVGLKIEGDFYGTTADLKELMQRHKQNTKTGGTIYLSMLGSC